MSESHDMKINDDIKEAINSYIAEYSLVALQRETKIEKEQLNQFLSGEITDIEEDKWEKLYGCVESFLPSDELYWPREKLINLVKSKMPNKGIVVPIENEDDDLQNDELRLLKLYRSLSSNTKKNVIQATLKAAEEEHKKEKNDDEKSELEDEFTMLAERVVSTNEREVPPKTTQLNLGELFKGRRQRGSRE